MVSFRNSQFQAILVGMMIADAVSQGQLPWHTCTQATTAALEDASAGRMANDDWCHAIAAALDPSSSHQVSLTAAPLQSCDWTEEFTSDLSTTNALLAHLPQVLSHLDRYPPQLATQQYPATTDPVAITVIFYACLQASFRQDTATLSAWRQQLQLESTTAQQSSHVELSVAIEALLAAHGDYQLAVGQCLQLSATAPGSVILTAILSASWGDLPSVPMRYRHWLQQPPPALQEWLQRRWHIATSDCLMRWAETLWQQWSGQHPTALVRSPLVPIQPLSPSAKLPTL